ncbi:3D domain-containing protein [Moorella sp. E306M]|uniref:3D domain-containing protein n=1 Tax=Moorella sp. E306M TaxID=2572683 RepID=UPI0010FFBCEB|nr:3D domain-containing protein [Moorella sp. E306M]GEA17772.1 cell wall-binding protein YocH [Moorella sp. E306M]GEA17841.1 cell wall-binding protein YocH [Moorella sp. E306M]
MKHRSRFLFVTIIVVALVAICNYSAAGRLEIEEKEPKRYSLYVIQPGDTLRDIAGRVLPKLDNQKALKELEDLNGLEPGQELNPGDIITIPDTNGELSEPVGPVYSSPQAADEASKALEKAMQEAARVKRYQFETSRGIKSRELVLEITAYTANDPGMDGRGIMFTGLPVDRGALAVDPRVIPLGSVVWIPEVGYTVALDVGRAIKGYKADLYIPDKMKALEWGRKMVRVKVLD